MSFYYLEVIRGAQQGRRYPLPDGASSVGRNATNAIVFDTAEKSVSSHHAIIYCSPGQIQLQDLQSTNGSFVNETQVQEQDLKPGDVIGFGKAGPRLKLVESDIELGIEPVKRVTDITTDVGTIEDEAQKLRSASADSTANEDQNTITRIKNSSPRHRGAFPSSQTMAMEQKLLNNEVGSADMRRLIRDGKRLEKIVGRGNLSQAQASMLRVVHDAHRRSHLQWIVILSVVVGVSVIAIAFFAIRAYQYHALLSGAKKIQGEMESVEQQIARANDNPDANKQKLTMLITELEERNQKLSTMKSRIDQNDFGKFYGDPLERTIDDILVRYGETDYHIPREMMERVKYHLDVYSGQLHNVIANYLVRKERYFPMILRVFKEKNLPQELAYVSMLESGFNPKALSVAGARGLWQFMPATGRTYRLRVDNDVDERIEPEKATYAAAEYFKDLIAIFGGKSSVMLCMAAYNAGEGRLIGALRKIDDPMRNRDFWYIYHMGYLAEETNEYIPRVMALMIISENPEKYGFARAAQVPAEQVESANDFVDFKTKNGAVAQEPQLQPLAPQSKSDPLAWPKKK